MKTSTALLLALAALALTSTASAQIARRFPSEKKIITDPVTGVPLTFLTSTAGDNKEIYPNATGGGDSKIYPTHNQWTSDGKWLIFRSGRVPREALAVNEDTGDIVQVTEGGYSGMLCVAHHSMKLYIMRNVRAPGEPIAAAPTPAVAPAAAAGDPTAKTGKGGGGGRGGPRTPMQIVEIDLAKVFADSAAGKMKPQANYERVCGTIATSWQAGGDMALDAKEDVAYFRISGPEAGNRLSEGTKVAERYGPRGMGAGPAGLASMNLRTGEVKFVVAVPFQVGHVQTNPFVPGEIVFCWETGGKAPQRTWTVMADGTGLRPLYPEAEYEWVTHEAVITKDEVAFAIMGHRRPGVKDEWGVAGTREHPTGLGIVNLRTREMRIVGQTPGGSGLWHVHGSADGRWAVGDDFSRSLHLIDRKTGEMTLLTTGHKSSAADHPHPTFKADGTKIQIQSAMLSADGRAMNICIVPIPARLLQRTYDAKTGAAQ